MLGVVREEVLGDGVGILRDGVPGTLDLSEGGRRVEEQEDPVQELGRQPVYGA